MLVFFFVFSTRVCVAEEAQSQRNYNVVDRVIDKFDYLIVPIVDALAGGTLCGPWCALIGGVIGASDEGLTYFGYTNAHYMSHGFLGLATGNMISKGKLPKFAGVVAGMLLPTGVPTKIISENKWAIAPVISTLVNSQAGIEGMIYGGVQGLIEELALAGGYYDKHYITFLNMGQAISGVMLEPWLAPKLGLLLGPRLANFIGAGLGLLMANWEEDLRNNLMGPANVASKLYGTMGEFIPPAQLNKHIEQQALAVIGSGILTQFLTLKVLSYEQSLDYVFAHLDQSGENDLGGRVIRFAIFIIPYGFSHMTTGVINAYFNNKLYHTLEDNVISRVYSGENILRLVSQDNSTMLLDRLRGDVGTMVRGGSSLATSAMTDSIKGACGFGVLMFSAPNVAIYNTLYNQVLSMVSAGFAKKEKEYSEIGNKLQSEYDTLVKHNNRNIAAIIERGGMNFTQEHMQGLILKARENDGMRNLYSMAHGVWHTINVPLSYILNFYTVASEVRDGKIAFDDRYKAQHAAWQASNLLSWPAKNAESISKVGQSIDHIIVLEGMFKLPEKDDDQITRSTQAEAKLVLKNLEIGVKADKRLLYKADEVGLDAGKIFAVTGKPGSGKSSLLAKIKGISAGFTYAKGEVIYPLTNGAHPKIAMISQKNYFPLKISLKEALLYPNKFPGDAVMGEELKQRMHKLLQEAFVASDPQTQKRVEDLDTVIEDITDSVRGGFSGGEQKLLLLVSVILQGADIVLLDEIFAGMGEFTPIAQKLIKKYLPQALVLSVDHEVAKHNHGFYDAELHVNEDKKLVLQPLGF